MNAMPLQKQKMVKSHAQKLQFLILVAINLNETQETVKPLVHLADVTEELLYDF